MPQRITPIPIGPVPNRITPTPLGPIGGPPKRVVPIPVGPAAPQRIAPTPVGPTMQPVGCPVGCVSEMECARRVAGAKKSPEKPMPFPKADGFEKYQKKIEEMERRYAEMGEVDEDEDLIDWDALSEGEEEGDDDLFATPPKKRPGSPSSSRPSRPASAASSRPSPGSPFVDKFGGYMTARRQADAQGLTQFTWNGVTYNKSTWSNGVPVWKRADGGAGRKKSPCSKYDVNDCEKDPACKFVSGPGRPHCRKRSPKSSKSPKKQKPKKEKKSKSPFDLPTASIMPVAPGQNVAGYATAKAKPFATFDPSFPMPKLAPI